MQSLLPDKLEGSRLSPEVAEPQTDYIVAVTAFAGTLPNRPESHHIPVVNAPWSYELTKRSLDLVLGTIGLALTSLFSLVVVPLIFRSSSGSAIFKQTRVGKVGKHFTCYKFRTMVTDAESHKLELLH